MSPVSNPPLGLLPVGFGSSISKRMNALSPSAVTTRPHRLYLQVLIAIMLGAVFGVLAPDYASSEWIKALGDGFIKLIKMVIAPIIFCTVVSGISQIEDAQKVGRVGLKALIYFEVVSTLALILGLLVGNITKIGEGLSTQADAASIAKYVDLAHKRSNVDFILDIIPDSAIGAFAKGEVLQVLLFSILFGFSLLSLGDRAEKLRVFIDDLGKAVFGVIAIVMKAAPIGAFGAMAYVIGKFGSLALISLIGLVGAFYLTAILFITCVLGYISWRQGFNIFHLLSYLKDELLIVLGTSSSESALPALIQKLERLGCSKSVVGLVVPTGYSFNLDGTNIYMTLATLFIAHAMGIDLSLADQGIILIVAMLTSNGSSGVSGAGFITLAATLASVDARLVPGMSLLLGVDKFMSECRALTNFIGNSVATIVISAWEGELDRDQLKAELRRETS